MSEDHPLVAQLRVLWRHPVHVVAVLLVGAAGSFVYSYGPLHRSERWQIGYLQERVDEQNRALRAMEEELAALRAQTSDQPDAADLAAERKEAQSAKRELAGAKKEVERAERTITSLRRSVGQWKSKYEKVQAEFDEIRESVVAADEAASTPPPPPGVSAASRITDGPSGPDGDSPDAPVAAPDLGEVP